MGQSKKIILLGHFGVGKTSVLRRYVDDAFNEDYLVTVGVHVKKKDIVLNDETITLIIWDIEGNTSIDKARKSYLLGTHGFIYVFDITRPETYEQLESEFDYLKEKFPNVPVTLAGNKADLFDEEFTPSFFNDPIFEQCIFTSAKTGDTVEDLFKNIAVKAT